MELKPGYKKTEVGVIPEDWNVQFLQSLSTKIMVGIASAATHAYRDSGVPMFRNQNIKEGWLDDSDLRFLDPAFDKAFQGKRLCGGDLLTARTGYPGTTAVVPPEYAGAQSFTSLIIRPDTSKISPSFLCLYINSPAGKAFFEQSQIGGAQKNVNANTLKRMPVAFPGSKEEQKAIASAVAEIDALTSSLEALISKKRGIKQAAMQELLTGKRRLPGFEGEWEEVSIGGMVDLLTGFPFPSSGYSCSGVRLLRGSNVKRGLIDWNEDLAQHWPSITSDIAHYELRDGDIVIAMDGALVGRSYARVQASDLPALLLQRVARIRSSSLCNDFLFYQIGSSRFADHCDSVKTSTAIPHISPADIRNFRALIPPTKTEQIAIAAILIDLDAEISGLEARLGKARELKQGMMQQLLTGKIRLI